MTSYGALDSSQPKDSRDAKFLKIGLTVQKLQAEMYLQLWPAGGARGLGLGTYKLLWVMLRLSRICVPIFSIFLFTVLWAAIDIP